MRFRTTSGLDSAVDPVQMKNVTFEHVKGVEEAKNELQEVVEFLKNPHKFTALGGKLPKGRDGGDCTLDEKLYKAILHLCVL